MNFDIKIKLRKDNMYDLYYNGEFLTSRGSYEAILDDIKPTSKEVNTNDNPIHTNPQISSDSPVKNNALI